MVKTIRGTAQPKLTRITASGSFTVTPGVAYAIIELLGGGGAGGAARGTGGGQYSVGGGGGAGGYLKFQLSAAQLLSGAINVTIGTAGTGALLAQGGTGGNTIMLLNVATIATAVGGNGGGWSDQYGPGVCVNGGDGGASGNPTIGILLANVKGRAGMHGMVHPQAPANQGSGSGGLGGDSPYGGPPPTSASILGVASGSAAVGFGAGGNGAYVASGSSNSSVIGGNGAPGLCLITEYFS